MALQRRPELEQAEAKKYDIKKPENFDLEKGLARTLELIRRNPKWVKEMAKK